MFESALDNNITQFCGDGDHYERQINPPTPKFGRILESYALGKNFKIFNSSKCQNELDRVIELYDPMMDYVVSNYAQLTHEEKTRYISFFKDYTKSIRLKMKFIHIERFAPLNK